jgi:hypothetical protein
MSTKSSKRLYMIMFEEYGAGCVHMHVCERFVCVFCVSVLNVCVCVRARTRV